MGTTTRVRTCGHCGKTGLAHTVVFGDGARKVYLGSVCAREHGNVRTATGNRAEATTLGKPTEYEESYVAENYDGHYIGLWAEDVSPAVAVEKNIAPRVDAVHITREKAAKARLAGHKIRPGWYSRNVEEDYFVNVHGPYASRKEMEIELGLLAPDDIEQPLTFGRARSAQPRPG